VREGVYSRPGRSPRAELLYRARIVRVFARTEFKLKYAGSILGYFWSLAKPLIYFAVLWVVFSRLFKTSMQHFGLYLIIGVVLFTYLTEAVSAALPSIVVRGHVLRRIAFPSIAIPLGTMMASTITFVLNSVIVAVYVGLAGETPTLRWLLLLPLFVEYVAFVLGIALIVSSLFVRFRDIGQIWEVAATVILYTSAIMYPIRILPHWVRSVIGFDPLVQVIQNTRRLLMDNDPVTLAQTHTPHSPVWTVLISLGLLAAGVWLHGREAPRFPELA
jgi:ABC-2 type transport system permease protein